MNASKNEAYQPIRDYAIIGDCHGSALVSPDGSVDWCCLDRFDADPVFCRILDAQKGGFLSVRPDDSYKGHPGISTGQQTSSERGSPRNPAR